VRTVQAPGQSRTGQGRAPQANGDSTKQARQAVQSGRGQHGALARSVSAVQVEPPEHSRDADSRAGRACVLWTAPTHMYPTLLSPRVHVRSGRASDMLACSAAPHSAVSAGMQVYSDMDNIALCPAACPARLHSACAAGV